MFIVVNYVPNWAHHFMILKECLGRSPNARVCSSSIHFQPETEIELKAIHRLLKEISATVEVIEHEFELPSDLVKIRLRGLPSNTAPEEVIEGLRELGFSPKYANIHASSDGPIIFQVALNQTKNMQRIWGVTELLNMHGVQIDPWRKSKRSARNNNYQGNHSNHNYETPCSEPTSSSKMGDLNPIAKIYLNYELTRIIKSLIEFARRTEETKVSMQLTSANQAINPNTPDEATLTSSRKKGRRGKRHANITPTSTISTSTQYPTDIFKNNDLDPLEVKASQFACENMFNILDVIKGSKVTNKAKILETAYLAASKIVGYRAQDNLNMSPSDCLGTKTEQIQILSTRTQSPQGMNLRPRQTVNQS
ncbi:unnamed protein product [Colias eurytheme]|nr:unnamed protein product [Colias eurytheme]